MVNFPELLELRSQARESETAFIFLGDGEHETERLTYGELAARARGIAAALRRHAEAGDRALLLFPPGLDFVTAFFGCLYAGVVAVPAYPPRSQRTLPRLLSIVEDAGPALALTTATIRQRLEASSGLPDGFRLPLLCTDEIAPAADAWEQPSPSPEALAFLQYTSGSTAEPKGVMVTHRNLMHNQVMIRRAFSLSADATIVGWLPLYHDMGLIGNVLQPLFLGARCVLMPPVAFLKRPRRWLEAIHRYRGTTSGGPNFAYDYCVRKVPVEGADALDLSTWTVAFNGAEPVRAETLERFATAFAPWGFRRRAFYPCYGLAEATLLVTGGEAGALPVVQPVAAAELEAGRVAEPEASTAEAPRTLVGCGHSPSEQRVRIVDPHSLGPCSEGRVGEIWVTGESVARGYWRRPEQTRRDFAATPAGEPAEAHYLRTGDLGFLLGGELFVTGRIKDLIILRGRNLYPQDLERTAEGSHPALRPGCGAAFTVVEDGEERLVMVQEVERPRGGVDHPEVLAAIRAAVAEEHEVAAHDVVLLRSGTVPKTSSGKIRRRASREAYLAGELVVEAALLDAAGAAKGPAEPAAAPAPAALATTTPELRRIASEILRRTLTADDERLPLTALGLDSLAAVELQQAVEEEMGQTVSLSALLDGLSLSQLAGMLPKGDAGPGEAWESFGDGEVGELPLSRGQEALWFLQRLAPASAAYHIAAALRLPAEVDLQRLEEALRRVVGRHGMLRTTFSQHGGEPRQVTHDALPLEWRRRPWPGAEADLEAGTEDGEEALSKALRAAAYAPFDLERGPLLRVTVLELEGGGAALVLAVHHLVADFTSLAVLFDELGRAYGAASGGPETLAEAPAVSFGQWVQRQRRHLEGAAGEELWRYWQEALEGAPSVLELPTDRPRPAVPSERGDTFQKRLPRELAVGLAEVCRHRDLTPFALLLAGYQALLCRYTGQRQVLVGCPTAGRSHPRVARVVGYFVNPIVLRGDLRRRPTVEEWLVRVRRTVLGALDHQELPFPMLAERLAVERHPGRTPVFQVLFTYQSVPRGLGEDTAAALAPLALGAAGARVPLCPAEALPPGMGSPMLESLSLEPRPAQFDLSLSVAQDGDDLRLALQYSADLFEQETIQRMAGHLERLLEGLVHRPQAPVEELPLLTVEEEAQLREQHRATERPRRPAPAVHRLFEAWVDRTPEAPALRFQDRTLTYGELERRANLLAHRLSAQGLSAQDSWPQGSSGSPVVGVLVDRSVEQAVALLAVLKAGGCYLPMDPGYPPQRLAFMLQDSAASVVLVGAGLEERVGDYAGPVLRVDTAAGESSPPPRPQRDVAGGDPAYLIYTSGSTGVPKGVWVPHGAVVNFIDSMAREPGLGTEDVLVSVTTVSFDIFGLELYLPWSRGAQVVLADHRQVADGAALGALVDACGGTVLQATPATWRLLLASRWREEGWPLKVLCGGEALPPELARQLLERAGEVWNLYGPTETTIWSAVHRLRPEEATVPIGRAVDNTQLHVVDRHGLPLPAGVPGELWIGGDGVACGYWRRPALTADRFRPEASHGFDLDGEHGSDQSGHPGGRRVYRTGDLVRRRPDGVLEFLGRLDHQVKVRGVRMELGEIESALAQHPAVRQAVVTVRRFAAGDHRLVAYLVAREDEPTSAELRRFLTGRLPEAMVPGSYVFLPALPLTPNGKIDRKALPAPPTDEVTVEIPASGPDLLEGRVAAIWGRVLKVPKVGAEENFFDLGGHSLLVAQVHEQLQEELGRELQLMDLFRYPTVRGLATFLRDGAAGDTLGSSSLEASRVVAKEGTADGAGRDGSVAVVGLAGRFPGAADPDRLWQRLRAGEECISTFTDEELRESGVDEELLRDAAYVRAGGVVEDADRFDAPFFGYNPREAELMDPQHRVFLECAWHALENAGYDPRSYVGRIGVFAGVGVSTYLHHAGLLGLRSPADRYQAFIGNDKDFVPTRVSYKLGLTGPSVTVQTACSSSLVAVHLARRSLLAGECDMALAGGVSIRAPLKEGYLYEAGGIPSPDGHCRAFDADAQGTVFGNGAGLVVLKRFSDALRDRDSISAVIRGSAVNNDGSDKIGYTAPSVPGQARVVREALDSAGFAAADISYIEAHGTGTSLGDPIEVQALMEVFAEGAGPGSCALGSVKTNIGHLDTAAGVAGLIKTVQSLRHRELPPSLHYRRPNPRIPFDGSPFSVNDRLREWPRNGTPRRAGVSSFGIGGTNAHVVLEEAPEVPEAESGRPSRLLLLSARSPQALERAREALALHLREHPDQPLADVAYTLRVGRRPFEHRLALVATEETAAGWLAEGDREQLITGAAADSPEVAFLFSGQGSQYPGMARDLYRHEPAFRQHLDRCAELLAGRWGEDLKQLLWPSEEASGTESGGSERLQRTEYAQPALFAVEYSLARLWISWGVVPRAMLGHSIGEYVAACLAGVFTLADALELVTERGRLMQSLPAGAMVSLDRPAEEVERLLEAPLALAAVNAPGSCVVSGPSEAVDGLIRRLEREAIPHRRLHTSHAFHSAMMDPILDAFEARVAATPKSAPKIPFVSNLTGTWITEEEATSSGYWTRHLRGTVRFAEGVATLLAEPHRALLEVGPGVTLGTLAAKQAGGRLVVSSLAHPRDPRSDLEVVQRALGRLWVHGVEIDRSAVAADEARRRVPLPGYPFEGKRYWRRAESRPLAEASLRRLPMDRWLWFRSWRQAPALRPPARVPGGQRWLLLTDDGGVVATLARRLREAGESVLEVQRRTGADASASGFEVTSGERAMLDPARREAFDALVEHLQEHGGLPQRVVYGWSLESRSPSSRDRGAGDEASSLRTEAAGGRCFHDLLHMVQALAPAVMTAPNEPNLEEPNLEEPSEDRERLRFTVLTAGAHSIIGGDGRHPEQALVLGPLRVIPQEYPGFRCQGLELSPEESDPQDLAEDLWADLLAPEPEPLVAWRGGRRWLPSPAELELPPLEMPTPDSPVLDSPVPGAPRLRLRPEGVYLITGGLGGLGLEVAKDLARETRARLVLVGRSPLPAEGADDPRRRALEELRSLGAEVLALQGDVEDRQAMDGVLRQAQERFGAVHGVLHAAGVAGGGLIQLKEPQQAARVLGPKVRGTMILEELLRSRPPLDFFVVFSSITAVAGGVGQVDYCAANAFCDAFMTCLHRQSSPHRGTYYLSIGWDRWQQVGMAVRTDLPGLTPPPGLPKTLFDGPAAGDSPPRPAHPLLDQCLEASEGLWVFASELSPESHWVLSEHLIVGQPTLPGTTYLEMARGALAEVTAAASPLAGSGEKVAVEIREVAFLAPLAVPAGQRRRVLTVLEAEADSATGDGSSKSSWSFRVLSAEPQPTAGFRWQEHARGRVCRVATAAPVAVQLEAVLQRCDGRQLRPGDGGGGGEESSAVETVAGSPFLVTGDRWHCLEVLREGTEVSIAELSLSPEQEPALDAYGLHPALLDVATGSVQFLHQGDFLPLAYQRLTLFAPLTRRVYSLLRQRPAGGAPGGGGEEQLLTCDLQLVSTTGEVLATVEGFSMRRIGSAARRQLEALEQEAAAAPEEHGILPPEGVEVLRRLILGGTEPHVVVSTRNLPAVLRSLDEVTVEEAPATAGGSYARPELESEYVAPADDLQGTIAAVWQRVLGMEKVGIYDNFFELGGTSLNGIQLAAELKRELGREIPTVTIFEAPTVAALARTLQPQDEGPSLGERSEQRAERKKAALAAQRRPRRR